MRKRIARIRRRSRRRIEKWKQALGHEIADERRERQDRIRKLRQKHDDAGEPFRLFDSIELEEIPDDAEAVAGYVNGFWPTFGQLERSFPKAKLLSIAVTSSAAAECLDIEPGDAENADAPLWLRAKATVDKPVLYTFLSNAQPLIDYLETRGIPRSSYRLWVAHWTHKPHLCGPSCGSGFDDVADATQFTDKSGGRNLDESLCSPLFLEHR